MSMIKDVIKQKHAAAIGSGGGNHAVYRVIASRWPSSPREFDLSKS
jgi:hypothetical protein